MPMVILSTPTHKLLRSIVSKQFSNMKSGPSPTNDAVVNEGLLLLAKKEKVE